MSQGSWAQLSDGLSAFGKRVLHTNLFIDRLPNPSLVGADCEESQVDPRGGGGGAVRVWVGGSGRPLLTQDGTEPERCRAERRGRRLKLIGRPGRGGGGGVAAGEKW